MRKERQHVKNSFIDKMIVRLLLIVVVFIFLFNLTPDCVTADEQVLRVLKSLSKGTC